MIKNERKISEYLALYKERIMARKLKAHEKTKTYQYKIVDGKKIKPVFYSGKLAGLGNYMAGVFVGSGDLVRNSNGRAIPYKQIVESDE